MSHWAPSGTAGVLARRTLREPKQALIAGLRPSPLGRRAYFANWIGIPTCSHYLAARDLLRGSRKSQVT
jgi:hypothetical protein